jgi:hypothetical protein
MNKGMIEVEPYVAVSLQGTVIRLSDVVMKRAILRDPAGFRP